MVSSTAETTAEILEKLDKNKIPRAVYRLLKEDWMSRREVSIEVDEPDDPKDYSINDSVRLCMNELEELGFLKSKKVKRVKESTDKEGKPRRYTDESERFMLDLGSLWASYFEEECLLTSEERDLLQSLLERDHVADVLEMEEMGVSSTLSLLYSQFSYVGRAGLPGFFDFLRGVARVGEIHKDMDDLLDLRPSPRHKGSKLEASKFFDSLREDDEASKKLSKHLDEDVEKFESELIALGIEHLKKRARERAMRVRREGAPDPATTARFCESFLDFALANLPLSTALFEKIADNRGVRSVS